MRALVVFESMFGDTEAIGRAIADGLSSQLDVEVTEVGAAPTTIGDDVDLVVVGGPTHAFGLSREGTRQDAARQSSHGVVSADIGLREWLERLESPHHVAVATFDTRVDRPRMPGSAARGAAKRLRRLGFPIAVPPESFYVTGTQGPLVAGEVERARQWGQDLAAEMMHVAGGGAHY